MIQLTENPIDTAQLVDQSRSSDAGAVVAFFGITRQFTAGRETVELQYDAYRSMAELELKKLESEARKRWPIVDCQIFHRLGTVSLAEVSVAIVVSSPHRHDAFRQANG